MSNICSYLKDKAITTNIFVTRCSLATFLLAEIAVISENEHRRPKYPWQEEKYIGCGYVVLRIVMGATKYHLV